MTNKMCMKLLKLTKHLFYSIYSNFTKIFMHYELTKKPLVLIGKHAWHL